jgi:SAM-dependent methyltransferase
VVLSRNGVMFFGDREAAFRNLARALRPGGRLVLMTWQPVADNEWIRTIREALRATTPERPGFGAPDWIRATRP